jgi:PST family polysaccharide transporter
MTSDAAAVADIDGLTVTADRAVLKRRSVRGAGVTMAAQGVRCVLQFSSQVALAHWLLPGEFGVVAMVAPVLTLVQIFNDLGLSQATVQRANISHNELSALFWINLAISLVLACLLAASAPAVAWFYHVPRLTYIVIACASLLVLSGGSAQQIALMNRRMQFVSLAAIDVACAVSAIVVGLLAAWAGFGAWSLIMMQAANSLTILILAWIMSDWAPSWPRGQGVGGLLRFGGHLTGFNLLAYAEANLGTILIGRMDGAAALGFYDRAYKLVIVPWWQISLPVARVAISLLSRLDGHPRDYAAAWRRMLQGLMLVAGPGLLWAALTADDLSPALLGQAWRAASPMMADLSLATVLVPFGASAYWLFVSQGRVREQLHYGLISGAAVVASVVIGVHWGASGVARSFLFFAVFVQGVPLWGATRTGPVNGVFAWRAAWPVVVGLAACPGGVAAAALACGHMQVWVRLCLLLGASYASCGLAMLSFPAGRGVLREIWQMREVLKKGSASF